MEHQKGQMVQGGAPKGNNHHLQRSSCYKINKQSLFSKEYTIANPTPEEIYIKGTDGKKTFVNSKELKEEARMTIERHGPEFIKDQHNFIIYDAIIHRTNRKEPKKTRGPPNMG